VLELLFEIKLAFSLISTAILGIASYTDLKKGIIPNKLTFSAIFIGLLLQLITAFYFNAFEYFYFALIATIATFLGGYALYRLGVWAGGDVKLFTAIAAFNPVNYGVLRDFIGLKQAFFSSISLPVFPLTLFIYSVFAILPFGAMLSIKALIERKAFREKILTDLKKRIIQAAFFSMLLVSLAYLLELLGFQSFLAYALLFVLLGVYGLIKWRLKHAIPVLLFFWGIWQNYSLALNALIIFAGLVLFYALIALFIKSREEVLRKKIKISNLKEGMIPAETIIKVKGKVIRKKGINISSMIRLMLQGKIAQLNPKIKGRVIADSRKARGLTEDEINKLKKLQANGLLENEIEIKLSGPFAPTVFLAYLIASMAGDLFWFLIL